MPLYRLRCPSCEGESERVLSFYAAMPLCDCGTQMVRVIQPIGMVMFGKVPPSLRKLTFGTAPFTQGYSDSENPNSPNARK